jgi:hypothetical protein
MYKRNISWEPVLHKNYKGMYNRNISWEPVLHKNYKGYWFPGDISLIHSL